MSEINPIEIENIYKLIIDLHVPEEEKIEGIKGTYSFEELLKEVEEKDLYQFYESQFYLSEIGKKIEDWEERGLIEINKKNKV